MLGDFRTRKLGREAFLKMTGSARVIEMQGDEPSVWLTENNEILKLCLRKTGFSSDRLFPYAIRFARNSRKLRQRGIIAPRVTTVYTLQGNKNHLISYPMIPGTPVSEELKSDHYSIPGLVAFFTYLHDQGVYFRSIHLSNILHLKDGRYGLIDVTDTRFFPWPLTIWQRAKNLGYIWSHPRDSFFYTRKRVAELVTLYIEQARLSSRQGVRFRNKIARWMSYGARHRQQVEMRKQRRQKEA